MATEIKIWLKWNLNSIVWGNNDYIWSEVYIIQKIMEAAAGGGGGGRFFINKKDPWKDLEKKAKKGGADDEEIKKFLEIVVRVNGIENKETRELTEAELSKAITVDHIKNTIALVASDVKAVTVRINKKDNK